MLAELVLRVSKTHVTLNLIQGLNQQAQSAFYNMRFLNLVQNDSVGQFRMTNPLTVTLNKTCHPELDSGSHPASTVCLQSEILNQVQNDSKGSNFPVLILSRSENHLPIV